MQVHNLRPTRANSIIDRVVELSVGSGGTHKSSRKQLPNGSGPPAYQTLRLSDMLFFTEQTSSTPGGCFFVTLEPWLKPFSFMISKQVG